MIGPRVQITLGLAALASGVWVLTLGHQWGLAIFGAGGAVIGAGVTTCWR